METVVIICEIIIGLIGLTMALLSPQIEDRLHGVFVVLLCLGSVIKHFFHELTLLCDILVIVTAAYGIFFIAVSIPHFLHLIKKAHEKITK
jgi:hypothetical protein